MNDRHFFSEHLWDWLAEGETFEHHARMSGLMAADPDCAAEHTHAVALRAGLRGGNVHAPEGFEARLKTRLAETLRAESPGATVVTPPASFWRRGPLLVLGGAAAVMALALVSTWNTANRVPQAPVAAVDTAPTEEMAAEPVATAPETGLLADREFENGRDSVSTDTTRRTDSPEDLQTVSRQRAKTAGSGR